MTSQRSLPTVIPPGTIVRLARADEDASVWRQQIGHRFRIGFYNPNDGLGCIWLVDEKGEYCQTTDREYLLKYFEIDELSDETDLFGLNRPPLGPI